MVDRKEESAEESVDESTDETWEVDLEDGSVDPEQLAREALELLSHDERQAKSEKAAAQAAAEAEREDDPVAQLRDELESERERTMRALADYENYRRRVERERVEMKRLAVADAVSEFLPVIDNLERALASDSGGDELLKGVEMINQQMLGLLNRLGVEPIEAEGQPFDPGLHEAVMRDIDEEVEAPTVVQELQRGYVLHERLLRAAMVRVAVPPEQTASEDDAESSEEGESDDEQ